MTTPPLIVIGENIHCTRVALRKGKRIAERDGAEAILYESAEGEERALPVTAEAKRTKDYEEGRVKHVQVAIETAMETAAGDPAEGLRYIEAQVRHQERAGRGLPGPQRGRDRAQACRADRRHGLACRHGARAHGPAPLHRFLQRRRDPRRARGDRAGKGAPDAQLRLAGTPGCARTSPASTTAAWW